MRSSTESLSATSPGKLDVASLERKLKKDKTLPKKIARSKSTQDEDHDVTVTPERRAVLERVKSYNDSKAKARSTGSSSLGLGSEPSTPEDNTAARARERGRRVTVGDRPVLRYFNMPSSPPPSSPSHEEEHEVPKQAKVVILLYHSNLIQLMSDYQLQVAQRTFTRVDEEHGTKGYLNLTEMEEVRERQT